jgi:hypothetical protein
MELFGKQWRATKMTKTIKLELTQDQIDLIGAGLSELPFKLVSSLMQELQKQIMPQIKNEIQK